MSAEEARQSIPRENLDKERTFRMIDIPPRQVLPPPGKKVVPPPRVAVLVAHGMGQQVHFETLQGVVWAVRREALRQGNRIVSLGIGHAVHDGHAVPRAELVMQRGSEPPHEVHFYEAYWAPRTEGKVTTLDAYRFLLTSAAEGIQHSWSRNRFRRWMFRQFQPFPVRPIRLLGIFLGLSAALLSLAVINGAILAVSATSFVTAPNEWPTYALRRDLTIDLALTEVVLLLFVGIGVVLPSFIHNLRFKARREARRKVEDGHKVHVPSAALPRWFVGFAHLSVKAMILPLVFAGGLVAYHLWIHRTPTVMNVSLWDVRASALSLVESGWKSWVEKPFVAAAMVLPGVMSRLLLLLATFAFLLDWIKRKEAGKGKEAQYPVIAGLSPWTRYWHGLSQRQAQEDYQRWARVAVGLACTAIALIAVWVVGLPLWQRWACLMWLSGSETAVWLSSLLERRGFQYGVIWGSALLASMYIRTFVRQYVGDVAAYLSWHKVSKFAEVYHQIREDCRKVFKGVYLDRESPDNQNSPLRYEKVVVVGHSLGSVIAYDTLNSLLVDDQVAKGSKQVAERTRALITFGSPLDKTAYIFRIFSSDFLEVREAAAAAAQPMIASYDNRPQEWVNIWSPEDWISGPIEYYDDDRPLDEPAWEKKEGGQKRVQNVRDPEACVPLAAHTQYWDNALLSEQLYRVVVS